MCLILFLLQTAEFAGHTQEVNLRLAAV